jgi:DNA-binding cell septation regulator SpoVG
MKITESSFRIIAGDRIQAIVGITLDNALYLDDIRIVKAKNRLCVEFPKNKRRQSIIVPKTMKDRSDIETALLQAYHIILNGYDVFWSEGQPKEGSAKMYANDEMRRCYGKNDERLCRMCQSWKSSRCTETNEKSQCPSWGLACGKFLEREY